MVEVQREGIFRDGPTEEELKTELVAANRRLADANSEVGRVLAEQRSAAHQVQEVGKALRAVQAAQVRRELATVAGTGPRSDGWRL